MKRVVIIGGGFAGLAAAQKFWLSARRQVEVELVDPRAGQHFLPLLPDIIGRTVQPQHLVYPFAQASARWRFQHRQARVEQIDLATREVETTGGTIPYDGLILAAGSETNWYGQDELASSALALDTVDDARTIRERALTDAHTAWVIAGGGYTGVEAATNLMRLFQKQGLARRVVIVDRAESVCASLPEELRAYVAEQVRSMGIDVISEATVEAVDGDAVHLSNGESIPSAQLVWTAGVQAVSCIRSLALPKTSQQRLQVDARLAVADDVYAAGDCAGFVHGEQPLRMGVQFSISEGWHAASNLLRQWEGRPPRAFSPTDPGYVVPMANNRGCGRPLGIPLFGRTPVALHYMMGVLRTPGIKNRLGLLGDLSREFLGC